MGLLLRHHTDLCLANGPTYLSHLGIRQWPSILIVGFVLPQIVSEFDFQCRTDLFWLELDTSHEPQRSEIFSNRRKSAQFCSSLTQTQLMMLNPFLSARWRSFVASCQFSCLQMLLFWSQPSNVRDGLVASWRRLVQTGVSHRHLQYVVPPICSSYCAIQINRFLKIPYSEIDRTCSSQFPLTLISAPVFTSQ